MRLFSLLTFVLLIAISINTKAQTGTINNLSKFITTSSIGSSIIYDNGTNVGIGTNYPLTNLQVGMFGSGTIKKLWVPGTYNFEGAYLSNYNSNGGAKLELVTHVYGTTSRAWMIGSESDFLNGALAFSHAGEVTDYSSLSYTERMRINTTGNVLIATTTDNSTDKLQINGSVLATSFKKSGGTSAQFLKADGSVDNLTNAMMYRGAIVDANVNTAVSNGFYAMERPGMDWSSLLTFNAGGSVGPLQMNFTYMGDFKFRNQTDSDPLRWTSWKYVCTGTGTANQLTKFTGTSVIGNSLIYDDGTNVGIGTATPLAKVDVNGNMYCRNTMYIGMPDGNTTSQIAGYSLAVNGTAIFKSAKVKSYGNWPDYVFDDKYSLLPLSELEKFLSKNRHLPNVPSAAEVEKDGIDLGNTQAILLKKIEELTLYVIEQNKKILMQQDQIDRLVQELATIKKFGK